MVVVYTTDGCYVGHTRTRSAAVVLVGLYESHSSAGDFLRCKINSVVDNVQMVKTEGPLLDHCCNGEGDAFDRG